MDENLVERVRLQMGLSRREFGIRLFQYPNRLAYDQIYAWETGRAGLTRPVKAYLMLISGLVACGIDPVPYIGKLD